MTKPSNAMTTQRGCDSDHDADFIKSHQQRKKNIEKATTASDKILPASEATLVMTF